ncbi:hypothetical protein OG921_04930 [Aldersonia sp. NBC_00410]|uniref:hypothetical protein n=1 Tax=Aldersonia sp. NBC_00410 TaxID=2975954 RepID=UPI002253825A|nr:hypothetical protein [Aldersonia sp. NBC_00410]MCX5042516.1 hypothetical protein [Aldersonia sp. NBC_00410]
MAKDWQGVSAAMRQRMGELDMTQAELVQKSGLAPMTIREMVNDTQRRRRSQVTLAAVSEALGWPRNHLKLVLEGESPKDPDRDDPVLQELAELRAQLRRLSGSEKNAEELRAINDRLDRIEQQLTGGDEAP